MKKIESAAVKFYLIEEDREIIIPCHRHRDAYEIMSIMRYKTAEFQSLEEGFLDSDDEFVSRREAYDIVVAADQLIVDKEDIVKCLLFSEDLW